jgi:hypothetical protein
MPRPRRQIQRAFLAWLSANRERFALEILPGRRTDRVLEFSFVGINRAVSGSLGNYSLSIAVEYENCLWDLLWDADASPRHVTGGCICALCEQTERRLFPDRPALWIDHLFEPLLEWTNRDLANANWLLLFGTHQTATWARLAADRRAAEAAGHGQGWTALMPLR